MTSPSLTQPVPGLAPARPSRGGRGHAEAVDDGARAPRILVVDDDTQVLELVQQVLRVEGFEVVAVEGGAAACELLDAQRFDLLITDLKMPGVDGLALLEHAATLGGSMRAIAMTGYASVETAIQALKAGADNYVIKPFRPDQVRIAVARALERQRLVRENEEYERDLELKVRERTQALESAHRRLEHTYDETLRGIAALLEHKESDATGRSIRVADLTSRIGQAYGLGGDDLEDLWRGALLHDIGKFAIPDAILFKDEPLTPDEERIFNTYCVIGFKAIESIPYLATPARVVLHHRERWDGSGYPCGLVAEEIPLGARAFAVASAYQEAREGRRDIPPRDVEEARAAVVEATGTALDPAMVEAFLTIPLTDLP